RVVPAIAGVSTDSLGFAALAFACCCWLTKRLCRVKSSLHWVDLPNEHSLHPRPTPRTGGIAVLREIVVRHLVPIMVGWPPASAARCSDQLWGFDRGAHDRRSVDYSQPGYA